MLNKEAQEVAFAGGELDQLAAASKLSPLRIEDTASKPGVLLPKGRYGCASEHVAHPQQQFLRLERLRQVVVAARHQPLDAIGSIGERRQHEDGDAAVRLPQRASEIETVLARHHHIED